MLEHPRITFFLLFWLLISNGVVVESDVLPLTYQDAKSDSQVSVCISDKSPQLHKSLLHETLCGPLMCPSDAPTCCGESNKGHYCIRGGEKCCVPGGSCRQGEMCCTGTTGTTCCGVGKTCGFVDGLSLCVPDPCASSGDIDSCLAGVNKRNCKWCCKERRCISPNYTCPYETPISKGEMCQSPCQYVDTCRRCLAQPSDGNETPSCIWCCATQSCVPSLEYYTCPNAQTVMKNKDCDACLFRNGKSFLLSQITDYFIIACTLVIVGVSSGSFVLLTIAHYCMRWREPQRHVARLTPWVVRDTDVRRHGFDRRTSARRVWWPFHTSITIEEAVTLRSRVVCCACHRLLYLGNLFAAVLPQSKRHMQKDTPCGHHPQHDGICAGVHNNSLPISPQGSNADNNGSAVALLPCGHLFCFSCMGLNVGMESKRTIAQQITEPPAWRSLSMINGTQVNEVGITPEGRAIAKCQAMCPKCSTQVTDALFPDRIVRL